ncbi:MAG TPA: DUF3617 family protein [Steroidobacteraceae bacterium]
MTHRALLLASLALLPLAASAADKLNVKLGLWEITSTTKMTGMPQLSPELLAKMSPQQRARMEEAFKAEASKGPKQDVSKECLTQKDLDQPFSASDRKDCTQTKVTTTRTSQEVQLVCTGQNKGTGTFHVDAPNPETVTGNFTLTSGDGSDGLVIKAQLKGRWLSSDCGDEDDEEDSDEGEDTDQ